MGFKKLISNITDYFSGKSDEAAMKLVESNPELFLTQAIEKEEKAIDDLKFNLGEINHLKKPIAENVEELKNKLQKIQIQIRQARNANDTDLEARATQLYKQRDTELDLAFERLTKIEENEQQLRDDILTAINAVEQMRNEKNQIIADLKVAKSQEEIMKIMGKSKRGIGTADSFKAAKDAINRKTSMIDSQVTVNKTLNNSNSKDPLAGL